MVTELGPVITGLVVAGRNSSGMASELGSMIVTEQIDAMRALGTDPTKKLVTPRVISTVFMGLTKPLVFGFIVATIGCYFGLSAKGGTQGVGRATTEAVVAAMILIIVVDVFVTR